MQVEKTTCSLSIVLYYYLVLLRINDHWNMLDLYYYYYYYYYYYHYYYYYYYYYYY